MDLYEALYTTRAMRRVKPDAIADEVLMRILDAAVRSPSGSNAQNWRFLVVSNRDTMARLGELYAEAWELLQTTVYAGRREAIEASGDEVAKRVMSSSQWLGEHFGEVPVVVLAYHRNDPSGASIYPAVWNLMLAARGQGVGATLTTILGMFRQDEVAALLDVPLDRGWTNAAAIPLGYPLGRWGIAKRTPVHEVVYADRWGEAPAWTVDTPLWP